MSTCDCQGFEILAVCYPILVAANGFLLERLIAGKFGPDYDQLFLWTCWAIGYCLSIVVSLAMFLRMFTTGSMRRNIQGLRAAVTQSGVGVAMLQMDEKRLRSICSKLRRHVRDLADYNRRYYLLNLLNMAFLWDRDHSGVLTYDEFESMTQYAIKVFDIQKDKLTKLVLPLKQKAKEREEMKAKEEELLLNDDEKMVPPSSAKQKMGKPVRKEQNSTCTEWLRYFNDYFEDDDRVLGIRSPRDSNEKERAVMLKDLSCSVISTGQEIQIKGISRHDSLLGPSEEFNDNSVVPREILIRKCKNAPSVQILEGTDGVLFHYGDNGKFIEFTHERDPVQGHVVSVDYELPNRQEHLRVKTGLHFDEFLAYMKNTKPKIRIRGEYFNT